MSTLPELALRTESWQTTVVPFEIELTNYVTGGISINADVFVMMPPDFEIDRFVVFPIGVVPSPGTAQLTLQLIQGLPDGEVRELTDVIHMDGSEPALDDVLEKLTIDRMVLSRPVFLRMAGSEPLDRPPGVNWFDAVTLLCSIHLLSRLHVETTEPTTTEDPDRRFEGPHRRY